MSRKYQNERRNEEKMLHTQPLPPRREIAVDSGRYQIINGLCLDNMFFIFR